MPKINCCWIEDQPEALGSFILQAQLEEIFLHPFKSVQEGLNELKSRSQFYDCILLDGQVYLDPHSEKTEEQAVIFAKKEIEKLGLSQPIFVFSGQSNIITDKTLSTFFDGKVYVKAQDDEKLLKDIKQIYFPKIKEKYSNILSLADGDYLPKSFYNSLYQFCEIPEVFDESINYFSICRELLEKVFHSLIEKGLIPKNYLNTNGSPISTACMDFIVNNTNSKHAFLKSRTFPVPSILENYFSMLLRVCHENSHKNIENMQEMIKNNYSNNYYLGSLKHCFLCFLEWYKITIDSKPKAWLNKWDAIISIIQPGAVFIKIKYIGNEEISGKITSGITNLKENKEIGSSILVEEIYLPKKGANQPREFKITS